MEPRNALFLSLLFTLASASSPSWADGLSDAERSRLTKGYKLAVKDDVNYYCRYLEPTGTRLPTKKCYTIEQLVEIERERFDTQKRLERKQIERKTEGT
jgi:hypothetical protein